MLQFDGWTNGRRSFNEPVGGRGGFGSDRPLFSAATQRSRYGVISGAASKA